MSERFPFGGFQPSQEDKPRAEGPGRTKTQYQHSCRDCNEFFLSDEALQLHMIGHGLARLAAHVGELTEELRKGVKVFRQD
jgi:hypothetical protein